MYPICAAIQALVERQECCDELVESQAGRQFCYNEVIHEEGLFAKCANDDIVEVFKCCNQSFKSNKYYIYDCESEFTSKNCLD